MIENSTSLLQEITNVINKEEIVNLNLTNNNKNILITKNDDTSEYWDYCISENGLFE